jgi:D-alanyl-D-alanine carboxypeptidase (penicillin-binding protein 5/6)
VVAAGALAVVGTVASGAVGTSAAGSSPFLAAPAAYSGSAFTTESATGAESATESVAESATGTTTGATARGPIGGPALGARGVVVDRLRGAPPLPRRLSASGWLVADLDTGDVLAARDPHGRYLPASTLKTLTALTLLPRLNPARVVTATDAAASVDGTRVGLVPRFRYRVSDLFTALLVVSGNDAATALAEAYGGSRRTLAAMNAVARRLNADDTVARNPSGLDARGQVTSAYDLALIARAALRRADFRHYIGIVQANFPAPRHRHYQIYTHDDLLVRYRGAIGVKDGYTVKARASYVGAATRHGHTLVVTVLHAKPYVWHEVARLLDWGFAARGKVRPVGRLVPPGPLAHAAPSRVAPSPTQRGDPLAGIAPQRDGGSGSSLAVPVGALAGLVVVGAILLSSRRRRRGYRGRRRLPVPRA